MKVVFLALWVFFALAAVAQEKPVDTGVYTWHDIVVGSADKASVKILEGSSSHLDYLEIHATTQRPGAKPNQTHANEDVEECIIVRDGRMKITIGDRQMTLGPEGVILLMPKEMHSIQNVGERDLTYYVMRYRSKKPMDIARGVASGGSLMLNADSLTLKPSARGGGRAYFDRSTAMCDRFEMHVSMLARKGPSHAPHAHEETEIMLILSGSTEMTIDNKTYTGKPGDIYMVNSQLTHGIRNATDMPCTYFAFKWR